MRLYDVLEPMANMLNIDHIVERTTKDGWTIEKWHSGKMVQTLYRAIDTSGGWTDIPYMAGLATSFKAYSFPQSFVGVPVVLASITGGNGVGVGVTTHPTNNNVRVHVSGSQSCKETEARDIAIMAIGKWK